MTSESQFQTAFTRWASNNLKHSCACELKFSKTSSIPFNAVKDHQLHALRTAKHRHLVYKISDGTAGVKPFDCFCLSGVSAYIVIMFHVKRGEKEFYMIDIDDWDRHVALSDRKSLTHIEAKTLATITGMLA